MKIAVSPGISFVSNPYFKLLNDELRKRGHELASPAIGSLLTCDIFHVNFPQHMVSEKKNVLGAFAAAASMICFMLILKLRRRKIIWTVHDVFALRDPHPRLSSTYMAIVRKLTNGYIFLSQSSRQKFELLYPRERIKPTLKSFHPVPPVHTPRASKRADYCKQLGLDTDDFIVGFLGDIKAYKNPWAVTSIPETLNNGRRIVTLVAGRADKTDTTSFEEVLATRGTVRINRRLDDHELESIIQIVDIVLLPYSWGWNSGFLFLVLSCRQRTLASNLPIFSEMQANFGQKWVNLFDLSAKNQHLEIAKAINDLSAYTILDTDREQLEDKLKMYSLSSFADQIESFYRAV